MKTSLVTKLTATAVIFAVAIFYSCRDNFDFEEFDKYDDSLSIEGQVAVPLIQTDVKFSSLKAEAIGTGIEFDTTNKDLVVMAFNQKLNSTRLSNTNNGNNLPIIDGIEIPLQTRLQGMFGKDMSGQLKVQHPEMRLIINNQTACDNTVKISKIEFFDDDEEPVYKIENVPNLDKEFKANVKDSFTLTNNEVENHVYTPNGSITDLDLTELLWQKPAYYQITFSITPNNVGSETQIDFDNLNVQFYLSMPLQIQTDINGFTIKDSTDFDFDSDIFDNVDELEVKGKVKNGYNVDFIFDAYFIDKRGDSIRPLIGNWQISAGKEKDTICLLNRNDIVTLEKSTDALRFEIGFRYYRPKDPNDYATITLKDYINLRVSLRAAASYTIENED